jgi:hypothetical protein
MTILTIVLFTQLALGAAAIYWATQLSERYNAWTTKLRERYPHINPPPTDEWRGKNTRIMVWLFRIAGAFCALLAVAQLLPIAFPN